MLSLRSSFPEGLCPDRGEDRSSVIQAKRARSLLVTSDL